MPSPNAPYHPIIFLRGYAGGRKGQNQAAADPFTGFNEGSTVYRAVPGRYEIKSDKDDDPAKPEKPKDVAKAEEPKDVAKPKGFIFESSLVRLMKDYGYRDVCSDGTDIMDPDWHGKISPKSVVIHHYYDVGSDILGKGKTPSIESAAKGLGDLILRVREAVCDNPDDETAPAPKDFRCYLLAHSMGGLVVRTFLQNPDCWHDPASGRAALECVDKVFTYATPHNGIEMAGVNVPEWLRIWDADNFSREEMAKYLKLEDLFGKTGRVDWLPEDCFESRKFFCMVGTNRSDYEEVMGLSRTFSGNGSDGLVRIANATVQGVGRNDNWSAPTAKAFAYRSHSGWFGIVNSEEAYQNLVRFLFGRVRVDIWLDIDSVRLPAAIRNDKVQAAYQFELLVSPRKGKWYLSRRVAEEDSVACRMHSELTEPDLSDPTKGDPRKIHLTSVFLSPKEPNVDPGLGVGYAVTLGVKVPDYEKDGLLWFEQHIEGAYLFFDTLLSVLRPSGEPGKWTIGSGWTSENAGWEQETRTYDENESGTVQMTFPFSTYGPGEAMVPGDTPAIAGTLRFEVSHWND